MTSDVVTVFFYGLFMDEALLASKGISAWRVGIECVDGYSLRRGRRATLVPDNGNRAYGILISLRADDVRELYSAESVADYVSEPVSVVLPDGTVESAVCYNLPSRKLEGANIEYATFSAGTGRQVGIAGRLPSTDQGSGSLTPRWPCSTDALQCCRSSAH